MGRILGRWRGSGKDDDETGRERLQREVELLRQEYRSTCRLLWSYLQVLRQQQGLDPGQPPVPDEQLLTLRVRERELLARLRTASARLRGHEARQDVGAPLPEQLQRRLDQLQRETRTAIDRGLWGQAAQLLDEWLRILPGDPEGEVLREEVQQRLRVTTLLEHARSLANADDPSHLSEASDVLDEVLRVEDAPELRALQDELGARLAEATRMERRRILEAAAVALEEDHVDQALELLGKLPLLLFPSEEEMSFEQAVRRRLAEALRQRQQERVAEREAAAALDTALPAPDGETVQVSVSDGAEPLDAGGPATVDVAPPTASGPAVDEHPKVAGDGTSGVAAGEERPASAALEAQEPAAPSVRTAEEAPARGGWTRAALVVAGAALVALVALAAGRLLGAGDEGLVTATPSPGRFVALAAETTGAMTTATPVVASPTVAPPSPTASATPTTSPTATAVPSPAATATPSAASSTPTTGPTSASPSPTVAEVLHVVQPGETLAGIARRYGVSVWELAQVNGIGDIDRVYTGQTLRVPVR